MQDPEDNNKSLAAIKTPLQTVKESTKLMNSPQMAVIHNMKKNEESMQGLFYPLIDTQCPLTPGAIVKIYERCGIKFTGSRGAVANIMTSAFLERYPGIDTEMLLMKLRIENPQSPTNFTFGIEVAFALHHLEDIEKKKHANIITYTLCTRTASNSTARQESIAFTGQSDSDVQIKYKLLPCAISMPVSVRCDYKDRELDHKTDIKFCRVRVVYNIAGYQDDTSSVSEYLRDAHDHLQEYIQDHETREVVKILKNSAIKDTLKLDALNKFILHNAPNKTHARMLMLYLQERNIAGSFYEKIIHNIDTKDASSFTSDIFDHKDKESCKFKETYVEFTKTSSYAKIKETVLDENLWKSSTKIVDLH